MLAGERMLLSPTFCVRVPLLGCSSAVELGVGHTSLSNTPSKETQPLVWFLRPLLPVTAELWMGVGVGSGLGEKYFQANDPT